MPNRRPGLVGRKRHHETASALLLSVALSAFALEARADSPSQETQTEPVAGAQAGERVPNDTTSISGIDEPARSPSDLGLEVASALLFVPRNVIDYAFRGAELAATLVTDRQLVPRYRELLGAPNAELFVFPTLFAETGAPASVGVRMIFDSPRIAASQRLGVGGRRQVESETRLVFKGRLARMPAVVSLETYYALTDSERFYGIGLVPRSDPRNRFIDGTPREFGYYTERRVRYLASGGLRLSDDVELLLSSSLYRRQLEPTESRESASVSAVFEPGSIPGLSTANPYVLYSEVAARMDSRRVRTRPSAGWVLESYAGAGRSMDASRAGFARMGARASYAAPVMRKSNLVTLAVALDGVAPFPGASLSFVELEHQAGYRGFDTRRDFVALLVSADYTWVLAPALGMRLFADAVTVAPSLRGFGVEELQNMRLALGLGLDAFAGDNTLASLGLSATGDGPRVFATFGPPVANGDRQHRQ